MEMDGLGTGKTMKSSASRYQQVVLSTSMLERVMLMLVSYGAGEHVEDHLQFNVFLSSS